MNERIQKLAEQAGCKIMDDGGWYIPSAAGLEKVVYTSGVGLEKFAELIMAECVRKIEDIAESSNDPQPIYRVAVELLEHFGVEA